MRLFSAAASLLLLPTASVKARSKRESSKISLRGGSSAHRSLQVANATLCPPAGEQLTVHPNNGLLNLIAVGQADLLCTLTKVTRNAEGDIGDIIPLARSYDNEGWGNAPGVIPSQLLMNGWNCNTEEEEGVGEFCSASLPVLGEGEEYLLTTYSHSLSDRDQVSRFLSAATFGVTPDDLDQWNYSQPLEEAMSTWMEQQILLPYTSHRAVWRRNIVNFSPRSLSAGRVHDICESGHFWRTTALSGWEESAMKSKIARTPFLDEATNTTMYIYTLEGQVRTIIDESQIDELNPIVNFTGYEHLANVTLALPGLGSTNETLQYWGVEDVGEKYFLESPLKSLPDPGPCGEGGPGILRLENYGNHIFGRTPSGDWLIYHSYLELRANTLDNPLSDGGGLDENLSQGETLCSNVPQVYRNFNEQNCRMSLEGTACDNGPAPGGGGPGTLICGSPDEISNDISLPYDLYAFPIDCGVRTANPLWMANSRRTTWVDVSLTAPDQLRQRTAFVLQQIFAIATQSILSNKMKSENFVAFYDGLLRHALGNFREVLAFVASSPMMGENLSYVQSKSHAYVRENYNVNSHADENFAREVMQLFTIGTVLLNDDGTVKRDMNGNEIESYTNEHILNFARSWTGYNFQKNRGNIETYNTENYIDPMKVEPHWRDKFPKRNLNPIGGYIGDHAYPLCEDFPARMFLMKGSKFRFLGGSRLSNLIHTKPDYLNDETIIHFELNATSQLRAFLCSGAGPDCKSQPPQNEVILADTLPCTQGTAECSVDTVRVIKVAEDRYWEFILPPCVEQAFFNGGRKLGLQHSGVKGAVCANERIPAAFEACCEYPTTESSCSECNDGNVCTRDLCTEIAGQCFNPPLPLCTNGFILETWYGSYSKLVSNFISDSRYPDQPETSEVITSATTTLLEAPANRGSNFGSRLRTYISPPATGNYTFWLKGDDAGELWLSTSNSETDVAKLAYFTSWKSSFDQNPTQKSAPIELIQGEMYYLEALYVESGGGDGLSIAWNPVGDDSARVIIPLAQTRYSLPEGDTAKMHNLYDDERVTYATATARCDAHAAVLSHPAGMCDSPLLDDTEILAHKLGYHWTSQQCKVMVKVSGDELFPGWIAIVHEPDTHAGVANHVDETTMNYFPAFWQGGSYPTNKDSCGGPGSECSLTSDGGCLCTTSVTESVAFDSLPVSVDDALSTLFIGAVDPSLSGNIYETETDIATLITAHKNVDAQGGAVIDKDTIFAVYEERTGRTFFLKNIISTVDVVGTQLSFRNAPHFMSLVTSEAEVRDVLDETEATLDEYFYHPNAAPFVATLFIQRFNIASNPTPAYVKAVAKAFRSGRYLNFGSGKYGDLSASVAAVLLYREARSPVLDADPSFGSIRQPLLKVLAVMRNFGLTRAHPRGLLQINRSLSDTIRQGPYDFDSVFSHFFADHQHIGRGSPGGLLAPEETSLDLPGAVNILNGLFNTLDTNGLNNRGFGVAWPGWFAWNPLPGASPQEVVDELATLMTSGRLNEQNKAIIAAAYSAELSSGGADEAKKLAMKLVATTGEFHSTNLVKKSSGDRGAVTDASSPITDYKAVVYLQLGGGVDSWNMLVPHTCEGNLTQEYTEIRGGVALDISQLHQIDVGVNPQPCSKFGIHPSLSALATLYQDGEALFVANAGFLSESVDKTNYRNTKARLFGHSSMSGEAAQVRPNIESTMQYTNTGVIGRMRDVLIRLGHKTSAISVDGGSISLIGQKGKSPGPVRFAIEGLPAFPDDRYTSPDILPLVAAVNNATTADSGFFSESWSDNLHNSITIIDELREGYDNTTTVTQFSNAALESDLGPKLQTVSRLQQSAVQRGVTRDFFFVDYGSFDHHRGVVEPLQTMFNELNVALDAYVTELKALGLWDSTVIVQTSEFGRTFSPNGNMGTDHAWGGNYWMSGGSVKGRTILGDFPASYVDSPLNIGNRIVPSTPWESIWNSVAEYMGVTGDEDLTEVCPNRDAFGSANLFAAVTMFNVPTAFPTSSPTKSPTSSPSKQPTLSPTSSPSKAPSTSPTANSSKAPSRSPTQSPINPTSSPTSDPSKAPTQSPIIPTSSPTSDPSKAPTQSPINPTSSPASDPSKAPTNSPSKAPNVLTVKKYICKKTSPGPDEICLNGYEFPDGTCPTEGASCGNGGKICHVISDCPGGPSPPTTPAPIAPPPPTPPTGGCVGQGTVPTGGSCNDGTDCCSGSCSGGKPGTRTCNPA